MMDLKLLKEASNVFRAINNPVRQKILNFINENARVTVGTIYKKLKMEQSVVSQHLAILRKENIVIAERDGKFVLYSINYERLKQINKVAREMNK
jgi:DNA-binding transcriptional ArsR family regulator